jgi:hypothetical protein
MYIYQHGSGIGSAPPQVLKVAGKTNSKQQRLRYGRLPVPDARADLYWGAKQPALRHLTNAGVVKLLMQTSEFEELLGTKLRAIDQRNGEGAGRPAKWSATQLETVLLYRRITGLSTVKRALERLTCDPKGRELLGLERLPSAPTLTRYLRQHFEAEERMELYLELDRRLRARVVQLPGFDQEARILGLDGSQQGTCYTPPIPETNKKGERTGKLINGDTAAGDRRAITAPDAGYVGGSHPKSGQGWQFIGMWTEHGTLVGWDVSPLNESERPAAQRVFDNYEREVLPYRDRQLISVCSADAGFSSPEMRLRLQDLGIVPNIHKSSHSDSERSQGSAKKRGGKWLPIQHPSKPHYGNWQANGHGELRCKCRSGVSKRLFEVSKKTSRLTIALRGQCDNCGHIRITAGDWRYAQAPRRYAPAFHLDTADPSLGNPLTFNDRLSQEYGRDRFGFGESVHASLESRFGLLKDRSFMRTITEVKTEFAMATSTISALLLEREQQRTAPTPLTLVAASANNEVRPGSELAIAA